MSTGPGDLAALGRFLELADLLTPHAIRASASLGLPQLVDGGVGTVHGLAEATGVDPGALASLLAHLAERGLLVRGDDLAYRLSDVGASMLHPDAAFHLDVGGATAAMDLAWAGLHHTLRTGEPGYRRVHGRGFWEHLDADPSLGASFDEYMRRLSTWTAAASGADLWPVDGTVVDVGGGDGRLLCDLLARRPALRGILVEQPATAQRAAHRFADEGLGDRVHVVEGSFFDPIPAGGDVYVLGQVLHDWPGERAAAILGGVGGALGDGGRVVVIDQVLDRDAVTPIQSRTDLLMRVLFGSRERTRDEWDALARTAGLRVGAVHPCDGVRMLVELHRRP